VGKPGIVPGEILHGLDRVRPTRQGSEDVLASALPRIRDPIGLGQQPLNLNLQLKKGVQL
jgi:hypothetical protein